MHKWLCLWLFLATGLGAAEPVHLLLITVDDMNFDSVGVYGCKVPQTTPNIDRLASEGMRFAHGHVTIAICQPTRAVWMTGRYPHNSGAFGFDKIKPGIPTLPETLKQHGYTTGILGKTEHVIPSRTKAFDYARGRYEMSNGRSAEAYAKFTGEFLAKAKAAKKPFFLMVNAHDPHRPYDSLVPADRRQKPAASSPSNLPRNKKRLKRRGPFPAPSRIYRPDEIVVPGFLPDLPEVRREIAQYFSSVRRADDVVGAVLQVLKEAGFEKNTLVMFKSDHGIAAPFAKTNVWRHSTQTPWIVRWPGVVRAGSVDTDHMVAGVDLAPTLLAAASVPSMKGMDGRSFLPVLRGQPQDGRDLVFTHINTIASKRRYTMRSVQDKQFGYIWNGWSDGKTFFKNESKSGLTYKAMVAAAKNNPTIAARVKHFDYRVPEELYDYENDLDARRNLAGKADQKARLQRMRAALRKHMTETNDPQHEAFEAYLKQVGG